MPNPPPIVTGISPKEGPPGTKVTIRGENLGVVPNDLIGLTICGVNCIMSAEWVSPSKIIARFGTGKGRGDVIVTTKTGGPGTCTVQFRAFFEAIGILKESAVFVDDSDLMTTSWGRKRPTSPSQLHQDNPLGISDESIVKKFPEDLLQELFPDGSGNLTSENFNPAWYLLENHNGVSFDDLNRGLNCLRHKVNSQKEGQLSFLKANVGSVMDQLDTLNALSHCIKKYKEEGGSAITDNLEQAVIGSKYEADMLFQDVLGRKDRADATRNALGVLLRFKFLFNLPCSMEKNIQKGDYDIVINDYARAKSLFADTEVEVFKKVYQEVEQRIISFRDLLSARLKELPLPLEEQKRLVRYLINLDTPGDAAWDCITYEYNFLIDSLNSCKEFHIVQDTDDCISLNNSSKLPSQSSMMNDSYKKNDYWQVHPPRKIMFVEELTEIMNRTFPELWKLGQAYFKGDLNQRDAISGKVQKTDSIKQAGFKKMALDSIHLFINLFRSAILPHTLPMPMEEKKTFGIWPTNAKDIMGGWLPHFIRYIRGCYSNFINLDLPAEALQIIQKLLFDLRVYCMNVMFRQATEDVRNLHILETWTVEVDDNHGGTTQLPILYENIVIETFQLVKEAVLHSGKKETELMMDKVVTSQVLNHIQKLLQAFADTLEILAFTKETVIDSSENIVDSSSFLSQDQKLMIVLSNCNYTAQNILPKLEENLQKNVYPNTNSIISTVTDIFHDFHDRVFDAYMELKSDPIVGALEQSMYAGRFDWATHVELNGVRSYIKEILHGIIAVHAEVHAISPVFLTRVLQRLIEIISEELSRLFSCIQKFSVMGKLQASVDLQSFQQASLTYKTNISSAHFKEALSNIPPATTLDEKKMIQDNLNKFQSDMRIQLMCFRSTTANQG